MWTLTPRHSGAMGESFHLYCNDSLRVKYRGPDVENHGYNNNIDNALKNISNTLTEVALNIDVRYRH